MAKTTRRNSSITSIRSQTVPNPVAHNFTNFRFNHLPQRTVRPVRLGSANEWTTPNPGGAQPGPSIGGVLGDGNMAFPPNDPGNTKV